MTHRSRVIALLQATAQCAATFVRAVGRPNNDPLDRELHRCIAEERDVARFTAALGQKQTSEDIQSMSALPPKADIAEGDRHVRFVPKADIATIRVTLRAAGSSPTPQ